MNVGIGILCSESKLSKVKKEVELLLEQVTEYEILKYEIVPYWKISGLYDVQMHIFSCLPCRDAAVWRRFVEKLCDGGAVNEVSRDGEFEFAHYTEAGDMEDVFVDCCIGQTGAVLIPHGESFTIQACCAKKHIVDLLGIEKITFFHALDGECWEVIDEYFYCQHTDFVKQHTDTHTVCVDYTMKKPGYYRAEVSFMASDSVKRPYYQNVTDVVQFIPSNTVD